MFVETWKCQWYKYIADVLSYLAGLHEWRAAEFSGTSVFLYLIFNTAAYRTCQTHSMEPHFSLLYLQYTGSR